MLKCLNNIAILLIFLTWGSSLQAQKKVIVSGIVTDSSGKPLSFVTLRLFNNTNLTQPIQSTYSKENGSFRLRGVDTGSYSIVFSHTSYVQSTQAVEIRNLTGTVELAETRLIPASGALKGVSITVQRPLIEQTDDKISFNAEDDPAIKTETAIDVLRKTPFVAVDGEDNISINGKTNFKVLLNGKETSMFARNIKEALRGFPGTLISKIEVITSPSAKYDGEGIGGLINIITKKKVAGYNGTVSSFSRTMDKLQAFSMNGNIKMGKLGATAFFHTGYANPVESPVYSNTIPTVTSAYKQRSMTGQKSNSGTWDFGNAEISYELDTLNTLSAYGNVNSNFSKSRSSQTIITDYTAFPSSTSLFYLNNDNNNPGVSVGTDYIRKFKNNKERELSFRFFGEFSRNTVNSNSIQHNPGTDRYIINNSNSHNNQYTFEINHILPLPKGSTFEAGAKAILRRANSDFQSLIRYDAAHEYNPNPANTDYFKYKQDVVSLYSLYSFKIEKSSFRIGARLEHTNVNGDFITSKTQVQQDYYTLLPNVQFSRKLNNSLTLVMNYTKRLQRPYITDLNPFVNNNDSLNITYGNPRLNAQTIHSISAQTRLNKGPLFAAINIEGSYSGNYIMDYSFFNPATGATRTTSLNIGKGYQANLNLNMNTKVTSKWRLGVNAGLLYRNVHNNAQATQSNEGLGSNFNLNTSYMFTPKFTVSSYVGLFQDPVSIQTTYPFNTWYNLALAHKFFKDKVNVSLRLINYLEKTRDYRTVTKDPNFYTANVENQIRRGVALALTYSFGKLTENVSKKKGVNNDDLLTKPQQSGGGK